MERRVAKKLDSHFTEFKNDIKNWFQENSCEIIGDSNKSAFLQYIFDYDNVSLSKEDFQKRKRIKILFHNMIDVVRIELIMNNVRVERKIVQIIVELILKEHRMELFLQLM